MNNLDLRINYNLTNDENKILNKLSQIEVFNLLKTKLINYRNNKSVFGSKNGLPKNSIALNMWLDDEYIVLHVDNFKYISENYVNCVINKVYSCKLPF